MWVEFIADYDWYPPEKGGLVHIAYKTGMKLRVRNVCALQSIAAGAARKLVQKEKDNATQNS